MKSLHKTRASVLYPAICRPKYFQLNVFPPFQIRRYLSRNVTSRSNKYQRHSYKQKKIVTGKNYNLCTEFKKKFRVTCTFGCQYYFHYFFCHQVVHLFHLVFRWNQDSNPRQWTMARIVSPRHSPVDQGASLNLNFAL